MKRALPELLLAAAVLIVTTLILEVGIRTWVNRNAGGSELKSLWVPYIDFVINRGPMEQPKLFEFADMNRHARMPAGTDPIRIWFFGGSTLEGEYEHWLAAEFLSLCRESGRECEVRNWGQSAFQIHQEKHLLVELLRQHAPPDIAIFYDGVNETQDTFVKYHFSMNHEVHRALYEHIHREKALLKRLSRRRFKTPAFLSALVNEIPDPSKPVGDPGFALDPAHGYPNVAANYEWNVGVIDAICRDQGIRCDFVWQPELLNRGWLSTAESPKFDNLMKRFRERLQVHQAIAESPSLAARPNFLDLQMLFRNVPRHIFDDHCHVARDSGANRLLAERIFSLVFEGKKDGSPAAEPPR
jgi:hypothetical protein